MSDWTPAAPGRVEGYFKQLNSGGRWGDDDQVGTVNFITAGKRAATGGLVGTGRSVSLARASGPQPALMHDVAYPVNAGATGAPAHPLAIFWGRP